jgi:hypothetical protein
MDINQIILATNDIQKNGGAEGKLAQLIGLLAARLRRLEESHKRFVESASNKIENLEVNQKSHGRGCCSYCAGAGSVENNSPGAPALICPVCHGVGERRSGLDLS